MSELLPRSSSQTDGCRLAKRAAGPPLRSLAGLRLFATRFAAIASSRKGGPAPSLPLGCRLGVESSHQSTARIAKSGRSPIAASSNKPRPSFDHGEIVAFYVGVLRIKATSAITAPTTNINVPRYIGPRWLTQLNSNIPM